VTIHIGITGTRKGWTLGQNAEVKRALWVANTRALRAVFHHGDCVGVDEQAHGAATNQGFITVSHPPSDPTFRAWCNADIVHHPRPYMTRNRDIVDAVSLLLVVPEGPETDNPRSGTWATYRMAVQDGVKTVVIMP